MFTVPNHEKKGIIMLIHVCPNQKMYINSKNGRKRCFPYETKASISFIPMKTMCLWCPIKKKRGLLCESIFVQIDKRILILKMVEIKVFLMKPKHNIIYLKRRMCLQCPIMKRKDIAM